MRVGEFSQLTGLPISTLHFYERKGLLHPARNSSGHRDYDEGDLSWVAFINRLRATGMPIADIARYSKLRAQGEGTIAARLAMLKDHHQAVDDEINRWQENRRHLDEKIALYEKALSDGADQSA